MRKGMASDFDNTLYFMFEDPKYRPGDREAVRAFRSAGGLFGVSTGRSLQGVRLAALDDVHFDFYILVSGSLVLDGDGKELYKNTVPMDYVKALDTVYTFDDELHGLQTHIDSFDDLDEADLYGISFYAGSAERAHEMEDEIHAAYGDVLTAYANTTVVDVVGKGCSKGAALEIVRQRLALDCVGAIGDSFNDTSMLQAADVSFTFDYAPQAVQAAADHIVGSVKEALTYL